MEDAIFQVVFLGVVIIQTGAWWTLFTKAGRPGWAILIPIYNLYIMLKVADKPGWWLLLSLIPIFGIVWLPVMLILIYVAIAQNFGKGAGFAVGLIFLPIIFVPILAFGDARYLSVPGASNAATPDTAQFTTVTPAAAQGWRS